MRINLNAGCDRSSTTDHRRPRLVGGIQIVDRTSINLVFDRLYGDGNDATVAVMLIELDADLLPRHQLAEPLPGRIPERLPLLRCVDARDANSVLLLVGIKDGDRVTVGNLDYGAFDDAGSGVGPASAYRFSRFPPGTGFRAAPAFRPTSQDAATPTARTRNTKPNR